jgi:hypothetical protein
MGAGQARSGGAVPTFRRMTHPHAAPDPSPNDGPFLRSFLATLLALLALVAALVVLVDPVGRFGTGLLPPAVSADRDQKAAMLRALPAPPARGDPRIVPFQDAAAGLRDRARGWAGLQLRGERRRHPGPGGHRALPAGTRARRRHDPARGGRARAAPAWRGPAPAPHPEPEPRAAPAGGAGRDRCHARGRPPRMAGGPGGAAVGLGGGTETGGTSGGRSRAGWPPALPAYRGGARRRPLRRGQCRARVPAGNPRPV